MVRATLVTILIAVGLMLVLRSAVADGSELERPQSKRDFATDVLRAQGVDDFEKGDLEKATASFKKVVQRQPDDFVSHAYLCFAYNQMSKIDDAIISCSQVIRLKPDFSEGHYGLGSAYHANNKYDAAIDSYKKAIQLEPGFADAHSNLGLVYVAKGHFDSALQSCEEAVRIEPDIPSANVCMGASFAGKGQFEEAVLSFKKVVSLDPESELGHWGLGLAYAGRGQYDEASAQYEWLKNRGSAKAADLLVAIEEERSPQSVAGSKKRFSSGGVLANRFIGVGLFIVGGFVYQLVFNFFLGLINMLGFGAMVLPGVGVRWVQDKLGGASERLEKVQDGLTIAFWSGPLYLFLTVLTIGLQASAITVFVGYFSRLYPANVKIFIVMGWIWLYGTIGFTGLIVYSLALFLLKLWLGGLGIFWSLMRVLPRI